MAMTVTYDKNMLAKVEKKLGQLKSEAPQVIKKALNATAKDAKKDLAQKAQETYAVKTTGFTKAMKQVNATNGKLEAEIKVTGRVLGLKDFKVSPASYRPGADRPDLVSGKVLKSGGLKALEKSGIKAFVGKFKNGHKAVMQREGKERLPVKVLYSPSIPKMVGSEKRVYGILKPKIRDNLKKNIELQLGKVMGK